MQVKIKDLGIPLDVKSKGIEFDVAEKRAGHQGDLVLKMTSLIWCKGKTTRSKGVKLSWPEFTELMDNLPRVRKLLSEL